MKNLAIVLLGLVLVGCQKEIIKPEIKIVEPIEIVEQITEDLVGDEFKVYYITYQNFKDVRVADRVMIETTGTYEIVETNCECDSHAYRMVTYKYTLRVGEHCALRAFTVGNAPYVNLYSNTETTPDETPSEFLGNNVWSTVVGFTRID